MRTATVNAEWSARGASPDSTAPMAEAGAYADQGVIAAGKWLKGYEPEPTKIGTSLAEPTGNISTLPVPANENRRYPATLLAEWNGCVTEIDTHYFSAALKGIFGAGVRGEEEDAEIPISDVSESDRELLALGNFFRLCVFYETREDGQPRRYTQVIFRRLPAYRPHELAQAVERASEIQRLLRVE